MKAVEYAMIAVEKMQNKDAALLELEAAERRRSAELLASLHRQVNEALDGFNGVCGLVRDGNCLLKFGKQVAKIEVLWETWRNPNSGEGESGYVVRYTVEGVLWGHLNHPDRGETGWYSDERFGKAMARHMIC